MPVTGVVRAEGVLAPFWWRRFARRPSSPDPHDLSQGRPCQHQAEQGPAGPNLTHIDKFLAFLFAEIERRHTAGIFDEPDDRKLALVNCLDLEPVLI